MIGCISRFGSKLSDYPVRQGVKIVAARRDELHILVYECNISVENALKVFRWTFSNETVRINPTIYSVNNVMNSELNSKHFITFNNTVHVYRSNESKFISLAIILRPGTVSTIILNTHDYKITELA